MSVSVVGIGADGYEGLGERARGLLGESEVIIGSARQLGLIPEAVAAERVTLPSPLRPQFRGLIEQHEHRATVLLASGDPMLSGIGSSIVEIFGPVEIVPAVSSVSLARARMGWSAESCVWLSLVGRDPHRIVRELAPGARLLLLASDGSTAATVAELLTDAGFGESSFTALSDLGAETESRTTTTAAEWTGDSPALTILAVECAGGTGLGWTPGLPDEAFDHDGQITKRDVRASALARLAPRPGELLWDVGAGAGSVGIEWMRAHSRCRAVAIERDVERGKRIRRNAERLGVPGLRVVGGEAPGALDRLETPDAIFVGGGATSDGLLERCWESLRPGGRLVVHGVTMQTESLLGVWHARHGGELTRLQVEHAEPIGGFSGWKPSRAVTQWAVAK